MRLDALAVFSLLLVLGFALFAAAQNDNTTATPSPTANSTATATPTPTPTANQTLTPTPSPTAVSPSPTVTASPTATPTVTATATPVPSPTVNSTATATPAPTATANQTLTPTPSPTVNSTATATPAPTAQPRLFYVREVWAEKSQYSFDELQRSGAVKFYASVFDDDGTPATPAEGTKVAYGIRFAYNVPDEDAVHVITDSFDGKYYGAYAPLSLAGGVKEGTYIIKVKAERGGIVQSLSGKFSVTNATSYQPSPTYPPTWSNYTQQKFCNYPYRCESPDNQMLQKCTLIPDVTTCPQPQSCYKCPEFKPCIGRCMDAAQADHENCVKGEGDCPAPKQCYADCKPQLQPYPPAGGGGGQPQLQPAGAFIGKGVAVSSSSASNYEVLAAVIKIKGKAFAVFKLGEKKFRTTEATYDDASRTFNGRIDGGSISMTLPDSQRISFGKLELGGAVYYIYLLRSGMAGGYGQPYGSTGGYEQQTQPYGGAGGQAGPYGGGYGQPAPIQQPTQQYGGGYAQPYNATQGGVIERIIQPPQPYAPMQAPSTPISPHAILPFAR